MEKIKNTEFRIKKYLILLTALISLGHLTSCSKSEHSDDINYELPIIQDNPKEDGYPIVTKQVPYVKLNPSSEPQKLIYDVNKNDVSLSAIKDTVVVYIEGGPVYKIGDDLNYLTQYITSSLSNYSLVGLRQVHEMNPTVFGSGSSFTNNNAEEVNDKTLDIANTVISWLKANHKVVYLFGHSNGSFMVQNYMSSNKTNADGYVISATRLKPIPAFVENYPNNIDVKYTNGVTVVTNNVPSNELPYFNVLSKLQLNHMKNYISLLSGNPMLSKTVYLLAGKDEALGRLENDEVDFINDNKIKNIFYPEGGHGDAPNGIVNALKFLRKAKTEKHAPLAN